NQLKSKFSPERFTPKIGSVGAKLKPVLHCLSVCGPSVCPFRRMTAAPAPPPLTSREPGWRSAALAEQVGFNSAVNDPGMATPGAEPLTEPQPRTATSPAPAKPKGFTPEMVDWIGEFSANDGTRKDFPQAPRIVRPSPTPQLTAT